MWEVALKLFSTGGSAALRAQEHWPTYSILRVMISPHPTYASRRDSFFYCLTKSENARSWCCFQCLTQCGFFIYLLRIPQSLIIVAICLKKPAVDNMYPLYIFLKKIRQQLDSFIFYLEKGLRRRICAHVIDCLKNFQAQTLFPTLSECDR